MEARKSVSQLGFVSNFGRVDKIRLTLQRQHVPGKNSRPPFHARLLLALQDLPLPLSRHPSNRLFPPLQSLLLPFEGLRLEEISEVEDGQSEGVLLPCGLGFGERGSDSAGGSGDDSGVVEREVLNRVGEETLSFA